MIRKISSLLLSILLFGCASAPTGQSVSDYQAALLSRSGADLAPQREREALRNIQGFLSHLTDANVRQNTRRVYAEDVFFNDTLKSLHGSAALEHYFTETVANTEEIRVDFTDWARSGNDYYLRWVMDVRFKSFAKGQTVRTIGMTHVRFNARGQVVLHQDYWDSGAGIWEHVPLIGSGIRALRARL